MAIKPDKCDRCGQHCGSMSFVSVQICYVCERWCCDSCINWAKERNPDKGTHDHVCISCFPK